MFARIMEGLAAAGAERKTVMIDATYLKAHRTEGGMNTRLHAAADANAP
ncbi:hypothetical protein FHS96_003905 [Sphingomonas zeicaulis]